MNTQLYIENQLVEIDNTVQFAITKQFEDMSNPTKIINAWSKTVKIPGTVNNNKLFGNIFRQDKVITSATNPIGINFDPSRKLDFKLIYNGDILMSGYAKLNTIQNSKGLVWYEINLFGMLGKILYDISKLTFDETTEDQNYYIDGSKYVNGIINAGNIYDFWTRRPNSNDLNIDRATIYDIIGWAPNNSYCEGFSYDTYQNGEFSSNTFANALETTEAFQANHIAPDTVIGDGLLPREIGEYRSYHQLPYIFMNKLFQIFKKETERVTGYDVELDGMFFNNKNVYYKDLVMMLKPLKVKPNESTSNFYRGNWNPNMSWGTDNYIEVKSSNILFEETHSQETVPYYDYQNQRFNLSGDTIMNINIPMNFRLSMNDGGWDNYLHFTKTNGLKISLTVNGQNGRVLKNSILVVHQDTDLEFSESDFIQIIRLPDGADSHIPSNLSWYFSVNMPQFFSMYEFGSYAKLTVTANWVNDTAVLKHALTALKVPVSLYMTNIYTATLNFNNASFRSNSHYTLNTLWDNEQKLFDIILNYCKIFRIMIQVDDINKKIKFISSYTYFKNHTISDWTNKVNTNKDFIITPITADNKYLLFNYEDSKSSYNEKYSKQFGNNFGEKQFNTDYQFNDNTTKLFDKPLKTSIVNTDNVLSWNNLAGGHIAYSFGAEKFIDCKDKDSKMIDLFGSMFLYTGLGQFDKSEALNLRNVSISDDTPYQNSIQTYFYSQGNGLYFNVNTYPRLDIISDGMMSTFSQPSACYTYLNNYSDSSSIYDVFWKLYLNEIYNIQNKKLACYMNISPTEYMQFDFNKFVVIDNILYMINKIVDYDISNYETTKVELIQITNAKNYWSNEYIDKLDSLDITGLGYTTLGWRALGLGVSIPVAYTNSITPIKFINGSTQIVDSGAGYTIQIKDNNVYITAVLSKYTQKDDIETTYEIVNESGKTNTISVIRYSMRFYPYFEINGKKDYDTNNWIYDGENEIAILIDGAEDYDLDVPPTITWDCSDHDPQSEGTFTFSNWYVDPSRLVNKWDPETQEYAEDFRPAWVGTMTASGWDQNIISLTYTLNGKLSGFTNTETFYIAP